MKNIGVKTETSTDAPPTAKHPEKPNKLSFKNFDIASVLTNGKTLLGSAGKVACLAIFGNGFGPEQQ